MFINLFVFYWLKYTAIHKLTKTAFAIKMRHANTDLYEFMDKSFDVRDVTKALRPYPGHIRVRKDIKFEMQVYSSFQNFKSYLKEKTLEIQLENYM